MKRFACVATVTALFIGLAPHSAGAATSSRIAFGYDGRHAGVYLIAPDGGGPRRISANTKVAWLNTAFHPDWSPDGNEIVFVARQNDVEGTFTVNTDGTDLTRVSKAPCYSEYEPRWSPDGRKIAFRHDTCEQMQLWVMGKDGNRRRQIIRGLAHGPEWRPHGNRWIAFTKRASGDGGYRDDVYVMHPDGSGTRRVTTKPGYGRASGSPGNSSPEWSPNGEWIAYVGGDEIIERSSRGICIVRFEGTGERCLTHTSQNEFTPNWSPTGERIVYEAVAHRNSDIYSIRRDGTGTRRLTRSKKDDTYPVWSPDGRWIAFLSKRSGNTDLFVMRSDGSDKRRLTNSPGNEWAPDWEPLPR
jgi:TolB protein